MHVGYLLSLLNEIRNNEIGTANVKTTTAVTIFIQCIISQKRSKNVVTLKSVEPKNGIRIAACLTMPPSGQYVIGLIQY